MDRWQPGSTPISNRARSVIISRRSGSDLGEANASPNYWRLTGKSEIEVQPSPTVPLRPHNSACNVKSRRSHIIMMLPRRGNIMLVRYFRRPSRIEQLRSSTGGHLLEGFAKELSQGCYQWVAARKHIRAAEHFLHWIAKGFTLVNNNDSDPGLMVMADCMPRE